MASKYTSRQVAKRSNQIKVERCQIIKIKENKESREKMYLFVQMLTDPGNKTIILLLYKIVKVYLDIFLMAD